MVSIGVAVPSATRRRQIVIHAIADTRGGRPDGVVGKMSMVGGDMTPTV